MRVSHRMKDERGATAVLLAFMLVVLIGILALSIDGGLLLAKYRQVRRASDAGALAAAISCGKQEKLPLPDPTANAIDKAGTYSAANVDPTAPSALPPTVTFKDLNGNPVSPQSCNGMSAGKVTVRYTVQQSLMFGPAVGVSSPKPVSAAATAIWGAAGGADNVAPLMISFRNTDCSIPIGTPPQRCHFWWDTDVQGVSTFGIMNLATWGDPAPCRGAVDANLNDAIDNGWTEPLLLESNPTYVCPISDGSNPNDPVHGNVAAHIDHLLPHEFLFPVNDPQQMIPACAPSATTCVPPERYAIVGFAVMTVTQIVNSTRATKLCKNVLPIGSGVSGGNFRCLEAVWTGWNTTGYSPGSGTSFGTIAVTLGQ